MTIIMFVLATIGLTNIIVHGKVLDLVKVGGKSVRQWMMSMGTFSQVWECYECTGFWAGLVCGLIFFWGNWWWILPAAFAGSVVSQTYTDVMYLLRSQIDFVVEDTNAPEDTEN